MTAHAGESVPDMPRGLLPLLTLLIFVVMMDARVMTAMLPEIASDLDSSVSAVGIALSTYLLAYGVFQLAYGPLADRVGAIRVMSIACIVFVAVLAAGAVVSGLGGLIAVRLITGAVAAAFFPLALATVGHLVAYERRQAAVGTLLAAFALGQIIGAALAGFVTEAVSWRAMFVLDAVLAAALVPALWRFRNSVAGVVAAADHPFAGHRRLLRSRRAVMLYGLVLLEGAAFFGGTGYLGALLHDEYGVSLAGVGLILTLDGAAIFVTSRLIGRIRGVLSEDRLITIGASLMGGGFLLALALGTWEAAVPAVIALGTGFALCHTTLQTRATELDPARGTAISLFAFALFLGSALGTALLARLLASSGYEAVLAICGAALLLVAAFAARLTAPRTTTEAHGVGVE